MRPETERLVRESWAQFEPVAVGSAEFFYEKLFELDPEAQRLFARTDMEAQGHKVMRMFAEIVRTSTSRRRWSAKSLTSAVGTCTTACRTPVRLGRHRAALDPRARPGSGFTDEVRGAWTEAYLLFPPCAAGNRPGVPAARLHGATISPYSSTCWAW